MRGFLAVAMLAGASCATDLPDAPRGMNTCVEGAAPAGVEPAAFAAALRQAQAYSDKVYGPDCLVCAEVLDDDGSYLLHITSPLDDMLINTSAAITVRKSDGKVTRRAVWHSCHAHVQPSGDAAPGR